MSTRDTANERTLTGRKLTVPGLFCRFHCVGESNFPTARLPVSDGFTVGPAVAICAVVAQLPSVPSVLPSVPSLLPMFHCFAIAVGAVFAVFHQLPVIALLSPSVFAIRVFRTPSRSL